jgi:hypothetical protein
MIFILLLWFGLVLKPFLSPHIVEIRDPLATATDCVRLHRSPYGQIFVHLLLFLGHMLDLKYLIFYLLTVPILINFHHLDIILFIIIILLLLHILIFELPHSEAFVTTPACKHFTEGLVYCGYAIYRPAPTGQSSHAF